MGSAARFLLDYFLGRELNPRVSHPAWQLFDPKMYLYMLGAIVLQLNILSAAAKQWYDSGACRAHAGPVALWSYELIMCAVHAGSCVVDQCLCPWLHLCSSSRGSSVNTSTSRMSMW